MRCTLCADRQTVPCPSVPGCPAVPTQLSAAAGEATKEEAKRVHVPSFGREIPRRVANLLRRDATNLQLKKEIGDIFPDRVRAAKKSTAGQKRTPISLVFETQGLNVRADSGTGFFPDEENGTT